MRLVDEKTTRPPGFTTRASSARALSSWRTWLNTLMQTAASNVASGLYVTDMETCYKAFRGEIIRGIKIESPRFGFEPEITAKIAALQVRVAEVSINYFPRTYLEGKKINWKDGVAAVFHILRFNLNTKALREATKEVPEKYQTSGRQWL